MERWGVTALWPQHDRANSDPEQSVSDLLQVLSGLYGELGILVPDIQFATRTRIPFGGWLEANAFSIGPASGY